MNRKYACLLLVVIPVLVINLFFLGCKGKNEKPPEEEDSYKTLATLGLTFFGQHKFNEASQYWEQALKKDPKNVKNTIICNNLFIIYYQQKKFDDCKRVVEIGLSVDPSNPALLNEKATLLKDENKFQEAIKILLQAEIALDSTGLRDYFLIGNLADCYRLTKQYEKGEKLIHEYIKKDEELRKKSGGKDKKDQPVNTTVAFLYHHLGMIKRAQGKHEEAIKAWQDALKILPDQDITHYRLAQASVEKNMPDKAIEHYKHALRINPNNILALAGLGYVYAKKGTNLAEAEKIINRALSLDPSSKMICMDSLALVHYKMKRYAQALNEINQAIELALSLSSSNQVKSRIIGPEDYSSTLADYYYRKGEIELALKKKKEAKKSFKNSMKYNPNHQGSKIALKKIR